MNDAWLLGPLLIKERWVVYFLAGLAAYTVIRIGIIKKLTDHAILETLWNALILFGVVWKVSYTLLHPLKVLDNPMGQLYFTGGDKGILLAFAGVVIYFFLLSKKRKMPLGTFIEPGFIAVLTASGSFHMFSLIMGASSFVYSALQILLTIILLVYWFRKAGREETLWPRLMLWYSLGELLISYFKANIPVWLGFSVSQWVFIALSLTSIILSYKMTRNFNES